MNHTSNPFTYRLLPSLMLIAVTLVACNSNNVQSATTLISGGTVTPSPPINLVLAGTATPKIVNTLPTATAVKVTATATATPEGFGLAARVNKQEITLDQFNTEMLRYLAADPKAPNPNSPEGKQLAAQLKDYVLDTLIDRALINQEASNNTISVTDKQIDDEIVLLAQARGGNDPFNAWLAANQLSVQDLRETIRGELLANIMRDRITQQLPRTAVYIHAYQIVLVDEATAKSALARLQNGARFTVLAGSLSTDESTRPNGGDLGWFTRGTGSILWPEVEDAAFGLKPGQVSQVVHSPIGYHIIKVVDRQTRALTPDDMTRTQQDALDQWMKRLRLNATIQKFI